MPEAYERWLVPTVFRPFAIDAARRVSVHEPRRVLEAAAGTGVLTAELLAALPSAEVTATDLNQAMVDLGRRRTPRARWRQADATSLPFGDAEYDVVACQFGAMFFPDKAAAFAEACRVLAPGGVYLLSIWSTLATQAFQLALVAGLERAFPADPPPFMTSVPHGYANDDAVTADLRAGGFHKVRVESVTLEGRASSAKDLAVGYCTGTPLRGQIEARGDLAVATATVAEVMEERLGLGEVTGTMTALVLEATK
jgi:SAM-dependent methyltransferase